MNALPDSSCDEISQKNFESAFGFKNHEVYNLTFSKLDNEKYLLSWETEEEADERLKWMKETSSDIEQSELYFQLEDSVRKIQNLERYAYRIMQGPRQIGKMMGPGFTRGTEPISLEDFRQNFHKIVKQLEANECVGYTICIDGEPAAMLLSQKLLFARMDAAFDILYKEADRKDGFIRGLRNKVGRFFKGMG